MDLIVILICLGLERYGHWGNKLAEWYWFEPYVGLLKTKKYSNVINLQSWQGLAWVVVPVIVVVWLIYHLSHRWLGGFVGFLLSTLILLYCLGRNPADEVKAFIAEDPETADIISDAIVAENPGHAESGHKKHVHTSARAKAANVSHIPSILWESNEQLFALLFWFVLLGPVGVLAYRMIIWTQQRAHADKALVSLLKPAELVEEVLDWIPARLVALGYALMGNFSTTIRFWLKNLLSGIEANRRILSQCGSLALGVDKTKPSETVEHTAQDLVDRTLVLFLVVIAVFTLGVWLY